MDICVAVYDKNGSYCKYVGTMMCSVMENTTIGLHFHILHDDTMTQDNREKLLMLTQAHKQKISFYNIDVDDLTLSSDAVARLSVGAAFKLKIPTF